MKKKQSSSRRLLAAGSSALLTALGFSSCRDVEIGAAEYGTPTVNYRLKLKVVDQDNVPVPGLELRAVGETKLSDGNGEASIAGSDFGFYKDHEIPVHIKDIDGPENGVVAESTQKVKVLKSDFVSHRKEGWDNGTVQKDIELKVERK